MMTRLLHEMGQARRRLAGLVPEDDLPYTEEDRENDRRFLGIPLTAVRRADAPGRGVLTSAR